MPSIYAALWSRPSTGNVANAGRSVAQGLEQLKKALAAAVRRIDKIWIRLPESEQQKRLKGVFVAPEYYFANAQMGSWDTTAGNFRSRPIEQSANEALLLDLIALSKRYPDYLIVPGSVAWRKPLDRSEAEKRKKDKITGLRTGPVKTTTRREKAKLVIGASDEAQRMGGQRLGSDVFRQAVIDAINGVLKGTPPRPCPVNLNTVFWAAVAGGGNQPDVFRDLLGEALKPPFAGDICAWAGLPPGAVAVIPERSDKVSAITSGTATHMMRNTAYVLHDGKVVFKYNKRGDFHESIGDNKTVFMPGTGLGKTNPIFGVTFGLEICLDHALGVLHTGVSGGSLPDLHIVLSDHVDNKTAHMKAKHYYLHASTAGNCTGVWGPAPNWNEATSAKLTETDPADGGTISYWKLAI